MRIGTNPEKLSPKRLIHKPHRVIIPVYIPNLEEEYFKDQLEVLRICLDSLLATTQKRYTNITIINNDSCTEVSEFLEEYFRRGSIDKLVRLRENRGKVEPILSEAMGSYEEYITISDSDVLFQNGWLEATMDIFSSFEHVGVVMPRPVPNNFRMNNFACLNRFFLSGRLKQGRIVDKGELKSFEKSLGSEGLMARFYTRQLYVENDGVRACLGAGHFVATYRREIFSVVDKGHKVRYVFSNGQEQEYLDLLTTVTRSCRLSTTKAYVYHMGNTPIRLVPRSEEAVREITFGVSKPLKRSNVFIQYTDRVIGRIIYGILKKFRWVP